MSRLVTVFGFLVAAVWGIHHMMTPELPYTIVELAIPIVVTGVCFFSTPEFFRKDTQ